MNNSRVREFAEHGRELLQRDSTETYGDTIADAVLDPIPFAQPGFVGLSYRGLVIIGQNPGRGTGDAGPRLQRSNLAFTDWRDQGWVGYERALTRWMADIREWRVWNQWVGPLLKQAKLSAGEVGYLNLVKVPTVGDKKPSSAMLDADWPSTRRQLELLNPVVVLAGGREVARQLTKRWPCPPFRLLTQNRARSENRAAREQQARALADEIRRLLPG